MEKQLELDSARHGLADLRFDNSFVRALPADPSDGKPGPPGTWRVLLARDAHHGARAAPARLLAEVAALLGLSEASCQSEELRRGVLRQSPAARAWSPTRLATAATSSATGPGSWATAAPSRSARSSTHAVERWELQLKGAGPDAVLAHGRRPRRAALVAARVPVQRGHAPPGRADHARAQPRGHRRAGGARHALRRQSRDPSRARWCAAWRPRSCASATSSSSPRATSTTLLRALADYTHDARTTPSSATPSPEAYTCAWLDEVCRRTADDGRRTGCASASCTA